MGGHDIGEIRHRIEMRCFGDRFDGGTESIERYRQQRLTLKSGGREGRKSILEFGGIGRERRCEGHQSGKERKRKGPFVRRKREREEGSDCFKDGSARVEREKRKVAAVSRFDSAMFPDSSRGTKGERGWRETD